MKQLIKYLVIDVDGTMTDSGIYYDEYGNELKKFCTKDAAGFFAARYVGIKIIVLTGRECMATTRRMKEMKVDYLFQNIRDKTLFLKQFMDDHNINKDEIGYIGDDLNDYQPMQLVGFVGCPADSCNEIRSVANIISGFNGGHGAVRDIIEQYLDSFNLWSSTVNEIYETGI